MRGARGEGAINTDPGGDGGNLGGTWGDPGGCLSRGWGFWGQTVPANCPEKSGQTVPTGRVIKYPKKCALFRPPGPGRPPGRPRAQGAQKRTTGGRWHSGVSQYHLDRVLAKNPHFGPFWGFSPKTPIFRDFPEFPEFPPRAPRAAPPRNFPEFFPRRESGFFPGPAGGRRGGLPGGSRGVSPGGHLQAARGGSGGVPRGAVRGVSPGPGLGRSGDRGVDVATGRGADTIWLEALRGNRRQFPWTTFHRPPFHRVVPLVRSNSPA